MAFLDSILFKLLANIPSDEEPIVVEINNLFDSSNAKWNGLNQQLSKATCKVLFLTLTDGVCSYSFCLIKNDLADKLQEILSGNHECIVEIVEHDVIVMQGKKWIEILNFEIHRNSCIVSAFNPPIPIPAV